MFAALQWMGARSEQGLSQVAATQHLALAQDSESEMATGRTAAMTLERIHLPVVDKTPLLHHTLPCSTSVLLQVRGDWQRVRESPL